MKKIYIISCLILFHTQVASQGTEIYGGLNAGFFFFRGSGAESSSFIIQSDVTSIPNYTNDIYGRKAGFGGGIEFSLQRVNRPGFIYGISTGIEVLKSKVDIDAISGRAGTFPAVGSTTLTLKFLNLQPFAGYRVNIKKYTGIDLTGGLNLAFGLGYSHEKGSAILPNDGGASTDTDRDNTGLDVRPGIQTRAFYKRFSLITGLWIGLTNYYSGYIGTNNEAYSRLFRTGIHYRITK